jgi:hypothetical protein
MIGSPLALCHDSMDRFQFAARNGRRRATRQTKKPGIFFNAGLLMDGVSF